MRLYLADLKCVPQLVREVVTAHTVRIAERKEHLLSTLSEPQDPNQFIIMLGMIFIIQHNVVQARIIDMYGMINPQWMRIHVRQICPYLCKICCRTSTS